MAPLYYQRETDDLPVEWIRKMRNAIMSVAPHFSARRMMKDYMTKFYLRTYGQKQNRIANE